MDSVPIVIDNGSYECRAGFANSDNPTFMFKSILAKNRANRKDKDWNIKIGNEMENIESLRWMLKSPFDLDVVTNFSIQEILLDYTFDNLNITSVGCVEHPVLITEAVANPTYSRKNMTELLIEGYGIPKISYGIDSLFSFHQNKEVDVETALIVSSGFQTTHILPVVKNVAEISNCQRLNLGGYNCGAYLQRLLELRYPHIKSFFTLTLTEELMKNRGKVSLDYTKDASSLNSKITSDNLLEFDFKNISKESIKNLPLTDEKIQKIKEKKKLEKLLQDIQQVICFGGNIKLLHDIGCKTSEDLLALSKSTENKINVLQDEINQLNQINVCKLEGKVSINTDLIVKQASEIIFQPSLVGFSQCGLSTCIENVLQNYPANIQKDLVKNIYVTGGNTKIDNFHERLLNDIRMFQPQGQEICIKTSSDASIDAWKGAAKFCSSPEMSNNWVTKNEYLEHGWYYLKAHKYSNT